MRIGNVPPLTVRPVSPVRPLVAASTQAAPAASRVKAQGADPLPTFGSSRDYQNYVINLVALARSTETELLTARKRFLEGARNQGQILALSERLDSIKLQLVLLRDHYPMPSEWTRSRWLGGEGFDKDKFWKEQVEAIPGKEVIVTPEPPKPEPTKPAPKPPKPAPSQPTPPKPPAPGDRAAFESKLALADLAEEMAANGRDQDEAVHAALIGALTYASSAQDCITVMEKANEKSYFGNTQDALVIAAAIRAGELMRTVDEAVLVAEAVNDNAYHGMEQDMAVKQILTDAVRLNPSIEGTIALAHAANENSYFGNTQNAIVTTVLTAATERATTVQDCIRLAETADDTFYNSREQDAAVLTILRRAISLATTLDECKAVMEAAGEYAEYSRTEKTIVNEAMAKGNAL